MKRFILANIGPEATEEQDLREIISLFTPGNVKCGLGDMRFDLVDCIGSEHVASTEDSSILVSFSTIMMLLRREYHELLGGDEEFDCRCQCPLCVCALRSRRSLSCCAGGIADPACTLQVRSGDGAVLSAEDLLPFRLNGIGTGGPVFNPSCHPLVSCEGVADVNYLLLSSGLAGAEDAHLHAGDSPRACCGAEGRVNSGHLKIEFEVQAYLVESVVRPTPSPTHTPSQNEMSNRCLFSVYITVFFFFFARFAGVRSCLLRWGSAETKVYGC